MCYNVQKELLPRLKGENSLKITKNSLSNVMYVFSTVSDVRRERGYLLYTIQCICCVIS